METTQSKKRVIKNVNEIVNRKEMKMKKTMVITAILVIATFVQSTSALILPKIYFEEAKAPVAPTLLYAAKDCSRDVTYVKWSDNSKNEDGFAIQRSLDRKNWETVRVSLPANSTGCTVYSPNRDPYYYRVVVYNNYGWKYSNIQHVILPG